MQVCPRCGDENPDRARFCQTCGEALDAPGGFREVRKTVTVLFMDVVGSTEMGERSDPESTRRVMSRLFDVVRPVLEHHGGTVEKFIGDAVMAVFGIPAVHEDDALRACRAALEIQAEIERLNKELERDWGITISTRMGVNTGEVIAGGPSSGQTLVTGDAVNTAARLEQSAPPGSILIGTPTYRLVAYAVDVEPVEPVTAKGKADAVAAYGLLSVVPGLPVRARRLDSPMVGRERELRMLLEAFDRSVAEARCVLATVIGMPGVGKSRLVHEFVAAIADRSTVLWGRCLPYGEGITFWPVVNLVHEAAGITEGDSPEESRAKIEVLLPEGEDRSVIGDRVAAAVGLGEAAWSLQETFWAIRKLIESVAIDRPLVVVFDDIHWGEPTFLDLVEYLEGWSRSSSILLLCIARPELLEKRSGWAFAAIEPVTITLDPLTGEESDRLIQNLLVPSAVSDGFRQRIVETAEGNPLFVEEMLGMLIDEDRLRREEGNWVMVDEDAPVPTPASIQSLLASRIEQLPAAERSILQGASVAGKVFWWGAVADLSEAGDVAEVGSHLQGLVRKGMIRPAESAVAGEDAFRFRHILIRDAAYRSLPRARRAILHERFADWLERIVGQRIEEYEEIIGYHLEQAYRLRVELRTTDHRARALAERAAAHLAEGGYHARARGDARAAIRLLERAGALLPSDHADRLELLGSLGSALREVGQFSRAASALDEAITLARLRADEQGEAYALIERANVQREIDPEADRRARDQAEVAIRLFEKLGDDRGLSAAWRLWSGLDVALCRWEPFREANERALFHARRAGDGMEEARALRSIAGALIHDPTPIPEAIVRCEAIHRELASNRPLQAGVLVNLGFLFGMQGRINKARDCLARARVILEEYGLVALGTLLKYSATVELHLAGDAGAAERELRLGRALLERAGEKGDLSTVMGMLSEVAYEQGRLEEAEELAKTAQELGGADDIATIVGALGVRAKVQARRGKADVGEAHAHEALRLIEQTDMLWLRGLTWMDLAEFQSLVGRPAEATKAALAALVLFEQKQASALSAHAREFLSKHEED
jgi:class 3 adenylate cyclase/tetratricopeptide (TPR) repeat protein